MKWVGLLIIVLLPNLALAQSDGSVEAVPPETSTQVEAATTTEVAQESTPTETPSDTPQETGTGSTSTPEGGEATTTGPIVIQATSSGTSTATTSPVSWPGWLWYAVGSILALAGIGYAALQMQKQKEEVDDRCGALKDRLESARAALEEARADISLKEQLFQAVREKVKEAALEEAKDKAAEALGETAEAVNDAYRELVEKYETAEKAYHYARGVVTRLEEEIEKLDMAYETCKAGAVGLPSVEELPPMETASATLFNVISKDGYIARKNGNEDFIPEELWPKTLGVMSKYDVIVMGRKTYEALQKYDKSLLRPFEEMENKKVVVTTNALFVPKDGYLVVHTPEQALSLGTNVLVVSGPGLNEYFLKKNLIDKILFQEVPVEIREGIKAFRMKEQDVPPIEYLR